MVSPVLPSVPSARQNNALHQPEQNSITVTSIRMVTTIRWYRQHHHRHLSYHVSLFCRIGFIVNCSRSPSSIAGLVSSIFHRSNIIILYWLINNSLFRSSSSITEQHRIPSVYHIITTSGFHALSYVLLLHATPLAVSAEANGCVSRPPPLRWPHISCFWFAGFEAPRSHYAVALQFARTLFRTNTEHFCFPLNNIGVVVLYHQNKIASLQNKFHEQSISASSCRSRHALPYCFRFHFLQYQLTNTFFLVCHIRISLPGHQNTSSFFHHLQFHHQYHL